MHQPDIVLMTVGGNDVLRGDFSPDEITDSVGEAFARQDRPLDASGQAKALQRAQKEGPTAVADRPLFQKAASRRARSSS